MKIQKMDITLNVNSCSSWIVYICKDAETANTVCKMAETMKPISDDKEAYRHVMSTKIYNACFVPEFFHNRGYHAVAVEHNRGNWDLEPTYELYLVY